MALVVAGCSSKKEIEQPNVLFISIDDLNDWNGPLGGNNQVITPNLDRFADGSTNFLRNYCTSPGCNPSRTTLLTGMHTYTSGMYSNYQDWRKIERLQEVPTLSRYFRDNGYFAAGAGKIFHYNQVDTTAWDEYYPSIKRPMPADNFPEERPASMPPFKYMYGMFDWAGLPISDEETADFESVDFIISQLNKKHDKPFFLAAGIYRPHLPWYVPQEYFDMYPLENVQLPALREDDTVDMGVRARELVSRGGNYHKHVVEAGKWQEAVRGYLASVTFADAMVGRLLEALEKSEYAENTIIVLWSDHGWQLGEKMHWRKFALWENVIRTVLMIKVPEGLKTLPGGSIDGDTRTLTSLIDIYPTLVELCNLPKRDYLDGSSLIPILKNPDTMINRPIITTYDFADYSVRRGDWHLISYVDGTYELYNLVSDPEEWTNLALDSNYHSVLQSLEAQIPTDAVPLPESSLIELMEHHIPPVKSVEYYFSAERKEWLKRFEPVDSLEVGG